MTGTAPEAINRTDLVVIGVLLAAAAALGLVLGLWGLADMVPDDNQVVPHSWAAYTREHAWVWWAVATIALPLAWIGPRWLLAQPHTDRVTRMDLTGDTRAGAHRCACRAITDAVQAQAARVPAVAGASASVHGPAPHRLHLVVDLTDRADLAAVRDALADRGRKTPAPPWAGPSCRSTCNCASAVPIRPAGA